MAHYTPEIEKEIDESFLTKEGNIFVFPRSLFYTYYDNPHFKILSKWSNTFPFIVTRTGKHRALNDEDMFFTEKEYLPMLKTYIFNLRQVIALIADQKIERKIFIFKLDEDKKLWHNVIKPRLEKEFEHDNNVYFLWEK